MRSGDENRMERRQTRGAQSEHSEHEGAAASDSHPGDEVDSDVSGDSEMPSFEAWVIQRSIHE